MSTQHMDSVHATNGGHFCRVQVDVQSARVVVRNEWRTFSSAEVFPLLLRLAFYKVKTAFHYFRARAEHVSSTSEFNLKLAVAS